MYAHWYMFWNFIPWTRVHPRDVIGGCCSIIIETIGWDDKHIFGMTLGHQLDIIDVHPQKICQNLTIIIDDQLPLIFSIICKNFALDVHPQSLMFSPLPLPQFDGLSTLGLGVLDVAPTLERHDPCTDRDGVNVHVNRPAGRHLRNGWCMSYLMK